MVDDMAKIASIEGIGKTYGEKLAHAGITTVETLLQLGATRKGRLEIATKAEVSEQLVLNWVNKADLFRIKGIGAQYAGLLENAGVESVPELAQHNPEQLLMKLQEVNDSRHLVRSMPYLKQVSKWVGRARELPRMVNN